jgi:hypothetical protein
MAQGKFVSGHEFGEAVGAMAIFTRVLSTPVTDVNPNLVFQKRGLGFLAKRTARISKSGVNA